jgi:hypothetical protein
MGTIKTFALAVGMSFAAMAASAATLDFTDLNTFTGSNAISANATGASGKLGSFASTVTWTLTPSVTPMKYNFKSNSGAPLALQGTDNGYDGTGKAALQAVSGLKLDGDGIGVRNDEITSGEFVTLTFSKAVKVSAIYVLDLFKGRFNGEVGKEIARISGDLTESIIATQTKSTGNNSGYQFANVDSNGYTVTSLTFRAGATNQFGDDGVRDYALAGLDVEVAPIPLPAGGLLLLTAIGGLAAARRRKQA